MSTTLFQTVEDSDNPLPTPTATAPSAPINAPDASEQSDNQPEPAEPRNTTSNTTTAPNAEEEEDLGVDPFLDVDYITDLYTEDHTSDTSDNPPNTGGKYIVNHNKGVAKMLRKLYYPVYSCTTIVKLI